MPSVKRGWTFSLRKISSLALPGFNPGESFGDRLGIGRRQDPSPKACGHIAVSNEIHGVVMTTRRAKKAVAQQLQGRRLGSQEQPTVPGAIFFSQATKRLRGVMLSVRGQRVNEGVPPKAGGQKGLD